MKNNALAEECLENLEKDEQYLKQPEQAWREFKKLGGLSLDYKRKAQFLIPILSESKVYLKHNFATLQEAASKLAGINSETVRKILSVHYRTENFPKLRKTIETHGYAKIDSVLVLAKRFSEESLVKLTTNLPTQALRQKVKEIKINLGLGNLRNLGDLENKDQIDLFEGVSGETNSDSYHHNIQNLPNSLNLQKRDITANNCAISGSHYQKNARFSVEINDDLQQGLNRVKYKLEKEKGHPITNRELLRYLVELAENSKSDWGDKTYKNNKIDNKINEGNTNTKNSKSSNSMSKRSELNETNTQEIKETKAVKVKSCKEVISVNREYPHAKLNKTLTPKHKAHVKQLNNGICQAESCNQVATEIHHKDYQSLAKSNTSKHINLMALCKIHHQLEHFSSDDFSSDSFSNYKLSSSNSSNSGNFINKNLNNSDSFSKNRISNSGNLDSNDLSDNNSNNGDTVINSENIKIIIKSHKKQWVNAKVRSHWHLL